MKIPDLEHNLAIADARLNKAVAALAPRHKGGEQEEYDSAHTALLFAERELAAAKGEQYAVPLEFPVIWDVGAPCPQLLVNDSRALLAFYAYVHDPNWDGTYLTVIDPAADTTDPIALVEFERCASAKLGTPNDEVFEGHPLYGRGLEFWRPQVVLNSSWLAELESINSVHRMYNAAHWRTLQHYVFWFKDKTFECLAKSFTVEVYHQSMRSVLETACNRLLG